jgi:thymidylate synthase (FAD)
MGDDLEVVNDARVSFGKLSEWEIVEEGPPTYFRTTRLKEGDARLIQFLARGCTSGDWDAIIAEVFSAMDEDYTYDDVAEILREVRSMPTHWTPFGQQIIKLHIKAPIFVARQLFKHSVGAAGDDMTVENEMSRRYVTTEPEFWTPDEWREASEDKKQGSGGPIPKAQQGYLNIYRDDFLRQALIEYHRKLQNGVAPEQARADLPQSTYTEWRVTGSLYFWASMYKARSRPDSQLETREIARQIGEIIKPLFPVSWEALTA